MFLKNKNIIFKIRRSKVTEYAALMHIRIVKLFTDLVGQEAYFGIKILINFYMLHMRAVKAMVKLSRCPALLKAALPMP